MMALRACVAVAALALGLISARLRAQESGGVFAPSDERTALVGLWAQDGPTARIHISPGTCGVLRFMMLR